MTRWEHDPSKIYDASKYPAAVLRDSVLHPRMDRALEKQLHFFISIHRVKLPCPAMLMEAATTSALLSANTMLAREGLILELVFSVSLRGLLPSQQRYS